MPGDVACSCKSHRVQSGCPSRTGRVIVVVVLSVVDCIFFILRCLHYKVKVVDGDAQDSREQVVDERVTVIDEVDFATDLYSSLYFWIVLVEVDVDREVGEVGWFSFSVVPVCFDPAA